MSRGNITRRGKRSWRIKVEIGEKVHLLTVRGKRQDAERELTRMLAEHDAGTLVEPTKVSVERHVTNWLDNDREISPKTRERYRELARNQIFPFLGAMTLQKLRPAHVERWHADLLKSGAKGGKPLAARTVGHAHRVCTGPWRRRPNPSL